MKLRKIFLTVCLPLFALGLCAVKLFAAQTLQEQLSALYAQGKFKETVPVAREMVRERPTDPLAYVALANALTSVNYTVADKIYKINGKPQKVRATSANPAPAPNVEEAIREYRKAIELRPKRGLYRVSLAGLLLEQKKWDEALAEYRRALALLPKTKMAKYEGDKPNEWTWYENYQQLSGIHSNMARALEGKKQYAAAVAEYRKSIALDNDYPYVRRQLADALNKAGRRGEARAEWKRIAVQTKFSYEAKKARESLALYPPTKP